MVALRACRAAALAGTVVMAVASHPSASRAAGIIEVPQPALTAEEADQPVSRRPPRLELAQFPPPPFYIDRNPPFQRLWFDNGNRSRRVQPPKEVQQGERLNSDQDVVREREGRKTARSREPNYALTRRLHGSYQQRIANVLRHSPRLPAAKGPCCSPSPSPSRRSRLTTPAYKSRRAPFRQVWPDTPRRWASSTC
jgi:hypothetical protein